VIVVWCGGRLRADGLSKGNHHKTWWDTAVPSGIRAFMTRYGGQMANGRVAISPTAEPRPADLSGSMPQDHNKYVDPRPTIKNSTALSLGPDD
jgi:hypothetical protein